MRRVYLDNHATTRVDPRVLEAMLPCFGDHFGNAASFQHAFGQEAHDLVEAARGQVARLIGASPAEICFTSGATESNNLAIKGLLAETGKGIVTVPTEHKSVLDCAATLGRSGSRVAFARVDKYGTVDLGSIRESVTPEVGLVSVMAANNEIGTIADLAAIGALCHDMGVLFHCDATQAIGRIPIDVDAMQIDLLSMSAHKIYGPKGIGALYVRRLPRVALNALIDGGGHERGLRSGTLNVPGCVGLGAACAIAQVEMAQDELHCRSLRDVLLEELRRLIPGLSVNGHPDLRLAGNLNVCIPGCDADDLMLAMVDVAVASGSACSSASPAPSHVLLAIGLAYDEAASSLRIGIGRFNSHEDVMFAASRIAETALGLRGDMVPRTVPIQAIN